MNGTIELSVISPVYMAADCVSALVQGIEDVLGPLAITYEIVLVEDGSSDGSWSAIEQAAVHSPAVRGIKLTRNFGQHLAIAAGLEACSGQRAIIMDCDLQDRPEEIPKLLAALDQGSEIVLAQRMDRSDAAHKRFLARAYHRVLRLLSAQETDHSIGTFSAITRQVIDDINQIQDRTRHYLECIRWVGYTPTTVVVQHGDRHAGTSSYSFGRLIRHAVDGLLLESRRPLIASIWVGAVSVAMSMISLFAIIIISIRSDAIPTGWPSLLSAILFVGGVTMTMVGVLGIYLGRLIDNSSKRPLYLIESQVVSPVLPSVAGRANRREEDPVT